ncbi:TetR-like C-terminal domain-containing protein [Streptomyces sp. LN704]|uniref:TetR-like C-terminal domain-containing protein n=1 Tax=unclassified Streptomyces TaxID=2593676 RepID=UPI0037216A0B
MPRAGLTAATVTEAAAALVDEVGFDQLGMGLVAERLGVKTPSLYKHVTGQTDLAHRIAILAMNQCADAIRDAIQGRSGTEALARGAQAMRTFVKDHHGRYAAANAARPTGPDDPLIDALNRVVDSWAAMLHGYRIDPDQQIHALRMLRTVLHGYASLEAAGGFQFATDIDDSFTWMIDFIDHGLQETTATSTNSALSRRAAPGVTL